MLKTAALALLLSMPLAAAAETYGSVPPADAVQVRVLPGWREGDRQIAALEFTLAPGWHTYWRAPGDAGIPPRFDWAGSANLDGVGYSWPVPRVFSQNGYQTLGYEDRLVLPITLTARDPGKPVRLRGTIDIGVCDEVCVPWSARIDAELPAGGSPDPAIRAALADRARNAREAGVGAVACRIDPIADGLKLTARIPLVAQGADEVVVIEPGIPGVWASPATTTRVGSTLTASAELVPPEAQPFALDRSRVRMTVIGGGRAVDITGCSAG